MLKSTLWPERFLRRVCFGNAVYSNTGSQASKSTPIGAVAKFTWDAREPKGDFQAYIRNERRYTALLKTAPDEAEGLFAAAEENAKKRWDFMQAVGPLM